MNAAAVEIRPAHPEEVLALARLWYDGWQDAHAEILPQTLARARTLQNFEDRVADSLCNIRVVGPRGQPLGMCMLKDDELNQLYVSAQARGAGVAAALIKEAESSFATIGVKVAWLACAIGNYRAARFYEKCGWRRIGTFVSHLDTIEGPFDLEVWRYEKEIARNP